MNLDAANRVRNRIDAIERLDSIINRLKNCNVKNITIGVETSMDLSSKDIIINDGFEINPIIDFIVDSYEKTRMLIISDLENNY